MWRREVDSHLTVALGRAPRSATISSEAQKKSATRGIRTTERGEEGMQKRTEMGTGALIHTTAQIKLSLYRVARII